MRCRALREGEVWETGELPAPDRGEAARRMSWGLRVLGWVSLLGAIVSAVSIGSDSALTSGSRYSFIGIVVGSGLASLAFWLFCAHVLDLLADIRDAARK